MADRSNAMKAPSAILADELLQEQASTLGRLGRALECALAELAAFDASRRPEHSDDDRAVRRALVREASTALWYFVVQRESCGLRNTFQLMRDYRVPPEVQRLMGAFPLRMSG